MLEFDHMNLRRLNEFWAGKLAVVIDRETGNDFFK